MKFQRDARKSQLVCLLLFVGIISTATQSSFAQANPPLTFGNNFFVTGDYIVAGAYNMNASFVTINGQSYTVGTINVPDKNPKGVQNPGITGATSVPPGGQIVAALLYWQAVEKVAAPGSGQNGFFRPLKYAGNGGPGAPGYAISGTNVSGSTPVSWSSGGCNSGSTGKVLRTYRADVGGGLPVDTNGNQVANGSFEISLPSASSNSTPLTLGATLVIIYRIPTGEGGPNIPLNAIVIYDGDYSQSNAQLTMTQQLQGFYDADANTVSRLTHIVGSGQINKFQTVYLGKDANTLTKLPFLYGNKLPAFPGWYGMWDNVTWTFTGASQNPSNPIMEDSSTATTRVVPSMSNQGCVSWGAVILSTTVKDLNHDGILYSWKEKEGYCDAAINNGVCGGSGDPAWVDLTGAKHTQQDVFLQYDYLCSSVTGPGSCHIATVNDPLSAAAAASGGKTTYTGTFSPPIPPNTLVGIDGFTKPTNNGQFTVVSSTNTELVVNNPSGVAEANPGIAIYTTSGDMNYSFDPRLAVDYEDGLTPHANAIGKVVAAYANHNIVLHAIPGNAIKEDQPNVSCKDSDSTCPFPNEPGTVGYRDGLEYIKNTTIEATTGVIGGCTPGPADLTCVPVFQHGKKDSYHYAVFSHGVGLPSWFLSDGSLKSAKQTGNTVTFTTNLPHGISRILSQPTGAVANDNLCLLGRVTVVFAITNSNLNGTYCVLSSPPPTATTFSITVGGSPTTVSYTSKTDPDLAVANGQVTSISGYSDVGGQNSLISLGYGGWGPPYNALSDGNKWQNKAGTFMHELGHTMFLTHGGSFYNNLPNNPNDFTPTFEINCKSNVQTSMSYLFQFDLLQVPGQVNAAGKHLMVVDYSEGPPPLNPGVIPTLTESSPAGPGILNNLSYANTASFQLPFNNSGAPHCDGTPLAPGEKSLTYVPFSPASGFFWSNATGLDIDFNGNITDVMHPHNEWEGTPAQPPLGPSPGVDLRQVSALGTITAVGPGGGGGKFPPGGGGGLFPPGGGGGKFPPGGGGGKYPPGGGGGRHEITHEEANSYPRPPQDLTITQEEASPRLIDLTWFAPTFGTPVQYNIYRTVVGTPFPTTPLTSVPGTQTTYTDTVPCNSGGYEYRVTAVVNNDANQPQESSPSNIVPAAPPQEPKLTGCYVVSPVTYTGSAVQGSIVPITWTLTDDFFITTPGAAWATATSGHPVTNTVANTLVANGPRPGNCTASGPTTILLNGVPTAQSGASTFSVTNPLTGQFTFSWDTDAFCAGSYTFTLTLDSTQSQTTTVPLQLAIDIGDTDSTPHITTLSVPDATVDASYNNVPLTEEGGVGTVTWSIASGSPPPNITLSSSGTLSGTPIVPPPGQLNFTSQVYNFTVQATDSATPTPNVGTQAFTLRLITPVSFKATPNNTGLSPLGVISVDFNNDGKPDLAIANSGDNSVSILLNNGDGTFTAQPNPLATGSVPYSLAAGDFNHDGNVDLVVTNFANGNPSTVSVFLGTGGGNFQTPVTYPVGAGPISVVTGDFNGDGFVDLAVANQNDHSVAILLGNGDGTFKAAVSYTVGTTDVAGVATGYFNNDAILDLAITSPSSDKVYVLLGNGDGSFQSPVFYVTGNSGNHPIAVSAVDFNGDNKLDLAITNLNAKTVAILLGNGDGTFQPRVSYPTTNGAFIGPSAMTTGDFNGDGKVDLAITEQSNNTVSILLGNADGTFQSPLEFTTGNVALGVAAGDFNADGRLDLAVANSTDSTVSVMLHLPQPPTNLATTNVTSSQVTLGWTASTSSGVAAYNVYQATTSGGPYLLLSSTIAPGFTDFTVTHGNTYYYVVTAVGALGLESVKSNEVSAAP